MAILTLPFFLHSSFLSYFFLYHTLLNLASSFCFYLLFFRLWSTTVIDQSISIEINQSYSRIKSTYEYEMMNTLMIPYRCRTGKSGDLFEIKMRKPTITTHTILYLQYNCTMPTTRIYLFFFQANDSIYYETYILVYIQIYCRIIPFQVSFDFVNLKRSFYENFFLNTSVLYHTY